MDKYIRSEGMDRFIRSENVRHYRELLERMTDNELRAHIKTLLLEEERKQVEAGDFDPNPNKHGN